MTQVKDAPMPTATQPTMSNLLRKVNRDIDMDLALTMAEVLNIYTNAIRRRSGRSTLGPDDSVRILHIVNQISSACEEEAEADFAGIRGNGKVEAGE